MIYFDNAATTPLSSITIQKMTDLMGQVYGNPSSTHQHGREASKILRQARQTIAQVLRTNAKNILFTSGATESNNTLLKGYALKHQDLGKHIITTAIEHHSVLEPLHHLAEKYGFEISFIQPVDGKIRVKDIKDALRPDTILVSTMFANNETGYLLPIKEIGEVLKDHPAKFHVDAVQAMGKIPIYPEELGIDFLSASAHKFHGPKGTGFLYAKDFYFDNLLHGGSQEDKKRAGTENIISIAGMATALENNIEHLSENFSHIQELRYELLQGLDTIDYYLNEQEPHLPHVLNMGFPGQANDILLMKLDMAGISVSTGSACTAGAIEPSHVLSAFYGETSPRLKESFRISFSDQNTIQEIHILTKKLKEILGETHGL